jgi:type II secretory pathway predicted ATPase ExeA
MNANAYRAFFGLQAEPFPTDLALEHILQTPDLLALNDRFQFAVSIGAIALVTGEVGAGKSTALRWATSQLHPAQYRVVWITASSGSILELYRQLLAEFDIDTASCSRAILTRIIRRQITELVRAKKRKPVLVIDEASLLRLDVFAELHTITQFEADSKPWLPIILAGQNHLADHLLYRTAGPLASRIVARSHLHAVDRETLTDYLHHHLKVAGLAHSPFEDSAITAIYQGSGGVFRKANHLARGALIAAASQQSLAVDAEHVRLAASELF